MNWNWMKWAIAFLMWALLSGNVGCAGLDAAIERASISDPGVEVTIHLWDVGLTVKANGVNAAGSATVKDPGEGEPEEGEDDGG